MRSSLSGCYTTFRVAGARSSPNRCVLEPNGRFVSNDFLSSLALVVGSGACCPDWAKRSHHLPLSAVEYMIGRHTNWEGDE